MRGCSDLELVFVSSKTKLSKLSLTHHVLKTLLALTCLANLVWLVSSVLDLFVVV